MTIETKRRVAKGLQLGLVVGVLVGLSGLIQTAWLADPIPALAQTVTVDSTQSPIVVNAVADLADLTPSDGQSVIIKTGTEKGLWYYDKDSATATSISVLNGPGSVGRFLVINNDAGSVAAATAITAAEIADDGLLELQAFDGSSAKSLTLEELKKTGVQVVNVKQYGATGDGVADDTAELQAAIDAALADGLVVYLPKGDYSISATLSIDTTDGQTISIIGDGPLSSRILRAASFTGTSMIASTTDSVTAPSAARMLSGCRFAEFGVKAQESGNAVNRGIYFPGINHSQIERVWVQGAGKAAFSIEYSWTNRFIGCRADNNYLHGFIFGHESGLTNDTIMVGCIAVSNAGVGLYVLGGESFTATGCSLELNLQAGAYFANFHGVDIQQVYCEGNGTTGLAFSTFNLSTLNGGPWTIKADIILAGSSQKMNSSTYVMPTDISASYPTQGVRVSGSSQRDTGVFFIAFAGCEGVTVSGYGTDETEDDYLFHANHSLAKRVHIQLSGAANLQQTGISLFDVNQRNYAPALFDLVKIDGVALDQISILPADFDGSAIVVHNGGTFASSTLTYRDSTLYRLGDTATEPASTDWYGKTINLGNYHYLRGKYICVVCEYFPAFNYNQTYASLYNGIGNVMVKPDGVTGRQFSDSVATSKTGEVATTGSISSGSPTLTVASASGLVIGDWVNINEAGPGATPGPHFSQITNISGTTITLATNATASVTDKTVRTVIPRISYQTMLMTDTQSTVAVGIQRSLGKKGDAIYISSLKVIPFGVQWPFMGN